MHPVMAWLKSKKGKKPGGKLDGVLGASPKLGKVAGPAAKPADKKGSGGPPQKVIDKDADDK